MTDKYGRYVDDIRISVTKKCNLKCIYCHHEGQWQNNFDENDEMTPDEIYKIVKIGTKFGIKKVKLTGGEPLIREDIYEIIDKISRLNDIEDISLVTNGILLKDSVKKLSESGLKRVNVSLDCLDPSLYKNITKSNNNLIPNDIIEGIKYAIAQGLAPLKLNMVMLKGVNETEIEKMIELSSDLGATLQLIELVPFRKREGFVKFHVDLSNIEDKIKKRAVKTKVRNLQRRMIYFLENGANIEFVKPYHNPEFCANCHRIRITSDGRLKPCLRTNSNLINILGPIREGKSDKELEKIFNKAIEIRKPYYLE
ncbi:MAG: GTP 3',8-cyclase MoaA [Candidatus Helarchaeota archaeon]|nr:GTP 3',8-cyclase MoaA [Candidatus Helarchaeota archaeon]